MRPGHRRWQRRSVWWWSLPSPPALRGADSYDHRHTAADEIGCERRQTIILVLRITILDRDVTVLDIAGFLQALEDRNGDVPVVIISGLGAEESDHRRRRLLRPRHHRPRRRAPEPRDELSPFHWITSSAVANSVSGIV